MEKNLSKRGIFPHAKCGQKSVLSQFNFFSCKICSVAIYALLRGEKLKPKIVSVEKKGQISGMVLKSECWPKSND